MRQRLILALTAALSAVTSFALPEVTGAKGSQTVLVSYRAEANVNSRAVVDKFEVSESGNWTRIGRFLPDGYNSKSIIGLAVHGESVYFSANDNKIYKCSFSGEDIVAVLNTNEPYESIAISPDGHWLAAADNNLKGKTFIYDLQKKNLAQTLTTANSVRNVAFGVDGRLYLGERQSSPVSEYQVGASGKFELVKSFSSGKDSGGGGVLVDSESGYVYAMQCYKLQEIYRFDKSTGALQKTFETPGFLSSWAGALVSGVPVFGDSWSGGAGDYSIYRLDGEQLTGVVPRTTCQFIQGICPLPVPYKTVKQSVLVSYRAKADVNSRAVVDRFEVSENGNWTRIGRFLPDGYDSKSIIGLAVRKKSVYFSANDNKIYKCSFSGEDIVAVLNTNEPYESIAISPDGHWLAAADNNLKGKTFIYDLRTKSLVQTITTTVSVRNVAFGADGRLYLGERQSSPVSEYQVGPSGKFELVKSFPSGKDGGGGGVLVDSESGHVYAMQCYKLPEIYRFDKSTGALQKTFETPGFLSSWAGALVSGVPVFGDSWSGGAGDYSIYRLDGERLTGVVPRTTCQFIQGICPLPVLVPTGLCIFLR